jgi:hypothetical protein
LNLTENADCSFCFGLFGDPFGETPVLTSDIYGLVFTVNTNSDGSAVVDNLSPHSTITAVPNPSAFWLTGAGLLGLIGVCRRERL